MAKILWVASGTDQIHCGPYKNALREKGYQVETAETDEELAEALPRADLVIVFGMGEEFVSPINKRAENKPPVIYLYTMERPKIKGVVLWVISLDIRRLVAIVKMALQNPSKGGPLEKPRPDRKANRVRGQVRN